MFNAMGMYPMNPASAEYVIGSPIFDKVEVRFPQSDHVVTISSQGAREKPYVKSLMVDGAPVEIPIISHKQLLSMHTLTFEMSDEPQSWGAYML